MKVLIETRYAKDGGHVCLHTHGLACFRYSDNSLVKCS